ncbi:MAG: discoidin domain-containing protein, partial [Clostridia bacterium]|nr:discoidin domain-containing protein [Clostridia bacterium]
LGITMNGGTLAVSSVKVTIQGSAVTQEAKKLKLVNNDRDALNTINPIANVERLASESDIDAANVSGSICISVGKVSNLSAFLEKCRTKQIIPTFYVGSTTVLTNLLNAINATDFTDINVVADKAAYLKSIRTSKSLVRTGLILNPNSYSSEHAIRVAVRSAPATFCLIDVKYITKELVMEIQEYAVAVWANMSSEPNTQQFITESITAATAGVNGVLSNSAIDFAHTVNKHIVPDAMTRTPIMIGHRGNPSQAPENTLSGFIKAYENGADVFEVDVDITKDGHVIIMHDSTITRTTTYTGSLTVGEMTLAQIKSYYILDKNGNATTERVPTLKEICDYFKDKDCKIFIEYKGNTVSNVTTTAQLLKDYGMEYLVDCISFNYSLLTKMQESCPGMSTGYLLSSVTDATTPEKALLGLHTYLASAQAINSTINPARFIVASDGNLFTTYATDRGMTVWPWTYSYSNNDAGFFSGCDGVTTDDMQWVTNVTKYLEADTIELIPGQIYSGGGVYSVTYGNKKNLIPLKDLVFSVIEGEEYVSSENGQLAAKAIGSAKVIFGYKTSTPTGGTFVAYSEPVTVTVKAGDAGDIQTLINSAKNISIADYSSETIAKIRELSAKGTQLINSSASTSEIEALVIELSKALSDRCTEKVVSLNKTYTTTATQRTDKYVDDGKRLTDGSKGSVAGDSEGYSGWNHMHPNYVDIVVDLGSKTEMDKFRAYAAAGNWGISTPKDMVVYVSDDGNAWKQFGMTAKPKLMSNTDTWDTYILEVVSEQVIEARYVKFSIKPTDTFVWVDEVEVIRSVGKEAAEDSVYVNGFNSLIAAGNTQIYTPDFGTINVTNANIKWANWIIAEWNSDKNAYVVKSVGSGNGNADASVTLASNQIMIAAHQWDIYETSENPVIGSQRNVSNVINAKAGDVLVMNGVDISGKKLNAIAPHITIAHTHTVSSNASCDKSQVCSTCETVVTPAKDHTPGEWAIVYDATPMKSGLKEQTCTVCGGSVKFEVIPATTTTLNNLAKGKSYVASAPYSYNNEIPYPDENGKTLTDGALAPEDAKYDNEAFVGFNKGTEDYKNDGYIYITVDLGKTYRLETFVAYFASKFNGEAGVYAPTDMAVFVSDDNETWTEAGSVKIKDSNAVSNVAGIVTLDRGVFGRYVQFRVVNEDHNWIMVSEVAVYGDEQTYIIGDVNNDGKVDSVDYLLVKRACFNTYDLNAQEEMRADVNTDKTIDSTDYLLVKRIAFGTYVA